MIFFVLSISIEALLQKITVFDVIIKCTVNIKIINRTILQLVKPLSPNFDFTQISSQNYRSLSPSVDSRKAALAILCLKNTEDKIKENRLIRGHALRYEQISDSGSKERLYLNRLSYF